MTAIQAHDVSLIQNPFGRAHLDLGGAWRIIVDPRSPGLHPPLPGRNIDGLTEGRESAQGLELIEFAFDDQHTLQTGRDWNTQDARLFFYESTVWYRRDFAAAWEPGRRYLLHFGAVNYRAEIWLNGTRIGTHEGGYTPFAFDVTETLKNGNNFLIVKVDARLDAETVPTLLTDWWNYGGIKREVLLLSLPDPYIRDYWIMLDDLATRRIRATFHVEGAAAGREIEVVLPALGETARATVDAEGIAETVFGTKASLWSPAHPQLYDVELNFNGETIRDRIGFRVVEQRGADILLNGAPVFLKGISAHEESPRHDGSAFGPEDASALLSLAVELDCNFVRLAHYPHNEYVTRLADELGLLVWSESPVYWQISWDNPATLGNAKAQVRAMVERDRNRASVIIWSVANETPPTASRLEFLKSLIDDVRALDGTRLVSAAIYGRDKDVRKPIVATIRARLLLDPSVDERTKAPIRSAFAADGVDASNPAILQALARAPALAIDDPLAEYLDVIAWNEYFGWYYAAQWARTVPMDEAEMARMFLVLMKELTFDPVANKPLIVTEFGADAKAGFEGDAETMMSESYQLRLYELQLAMLAKSRRLRGLSPWVLKDFRSPLRTHPAYQDYYNRKGLVDETGVKKKTFAYLQRNYRALGDAPLQSWAEDFFDRERVEAIRTTARHITRKQEAKMTNTASAYVLPPHLEDELAKVHAYWKGLIRGQASDMPYWDDVKLTALPGLEGRLMLVTAFTRPERFRFDIVGRDVSARYGKALAGSFADEIDTHDPLNFFQSQASATVEGHAPTYYRTSDYSRLLLPLWGDGHISMLLGAVAWL